MTRPAVTGARRRRREAALQILFGVELAGTTATRATDHYYKAFDGEPEGRDYARVLVEGVESSLASLDEAVQKASVHWRLERMARVDRNLLRIGAYEILHQPDVPVAVLLDEAIELAKLYGTEDSPAFINGVLNRLAEDAGRKEASTRDSSPPSRKKR